MTVADGASQPGPVFCDGVLPSMLGGNDESGSAASAFPTVALTPFPTPTSATPTTAAPSALVDGALCGNHTAIWSPSVRVGEFESLASWVQRDAPTRVSNVQLDGSLLPEEVDSDAEHILEAYLSSDVSIATLFLYAAELRFYEHGASLSVLSNGNATFCDGVMPGFFERGAGSYMNSTAAPSLSPTSVPTSTAGPTTSAPSLLVDDVLCGNRTVIWNPRVHAGDFHAPASWLTAITPGHTSNVQIDGSLGLDQRS